MAFDLLLVPSFALIHPDGLYTMQVLNVTAYLAMNLLLLVC